MGFCRRRRFLWPFRLRKCCGRSARFGQMRRRLEVRREACSGFGGGCGLSGPLRGREFHWRRRRRCLRWRWHRARRWHHRRARCRCRRWALCRGGQRRARCHRRRRRRRRGHESRRRDRSGIPNRSPPTFADPRRHPRAVFGHAGRRSVLPLSRGRIAHRRIRRWHVGGPLPAFRVRLTGARGEPHADRQPCCWSGDAINLDPICLLELSYRRSCLWTVRAIDWHADKIL